MILKNVPPCGDALYILNIDSPHSQTSALQFLVRIFPAVHSSVKYCWLPGMHISIKKYAYSL